MCDKKYSINDIKNQLYPVFDRHKIKKAILFGSYAKGTANEKSDVDLLLDSNLKGLNFVGLIHDISNALDKNVDVLDVTHIIPGSLILSEIDKDGIVIYG